MPKALSFFAVLFLVAGVLTGNPSRAADKPLSQDEVKAITLKAASLLADKGVDGARSAFYADGEYKHGELYVNVIDQKGIWLIYPPKPSAEGRSVLEVKDVDGKPLVRDILALANAKGEGWIEYRWMNPVTNQIQPKMTYVKAVPSRGIVAYVGMYK